MVARGRVRNGVVVLDAGVRLPEGQEVSVLAPDGVTAQPESSGGQHEWRTSAGEIPGAPSHSILDIPPVSLGPILRPLPSDDDLLSEMLEGRA